MIYQQGFLRFGSHVLALQHSPFHSFNCIQSCHRRSLHQPSQPCTFWQSLVGATHPTATQDPQLAETRQGSHWDYVKRIQQVSNVIGHFRLFSYRDRPFSLYGISIVNQCQGCHMTTLGPLGAHYGPACCVPRPYLHCTLLSLQKARQATMRLAALLTSHYTLFASVELHWMRPQQRHERRDNSQ